MSEFTIFFLSWATLLSYILQVQRGEVNWQVFSHASALTLRFQGCTRVICQVDSYVNVLISSHILWYFYSSLPREVVWQREIGGGGSDFRDRDAHRATTPPQEKPSTSRTSTLQPAAHYSARRTCCTFPGVRRWRGLEHPAAQRASSCTHARTHTHTVQRRAAAHTAHTTRHETFIQLLSLSLHTSTHSNATSLNPSLRPPTTHTERQGTTHPCFSFCQGF